MKFKIYYTMPVTFVVEQEAQCEEEAIELSQPYNLPLEYIEDIDYSWVDVSVEEVSQ